jgi:hypothetical protein
VCACKENSQHLWQSKSECMCLLALAILELVGAAEWWLSG